MIMLARSNFNFLLQGNILEVYEYDIMHSICPESENGEILTLFMVHFFFASSVFGRFLVVSNKSNVINDKCGKRAEYSNTYCRIVIQYIHTHKIHVF
jgi:hypothetical protein